MTGKQADRRVSQVNITANKNTVPFDPESPFVTSGLRLGSPAMTSRGMGTEEFTEIGNIIADCLLNPEDEAIAADCRRRVAQLCEKFPLYPHLNVPVAAIA
jgi:glycine hydroxymethyltransferase